METEPLVTREIQILKRLAVCNGGRFYIYTHIIYETLSLQESISILTQTFLQYATTFRL
jgi:hypothetical protein